MSASSQIDAATVVPFAPPAIGQEEIDAVVSALRSGWLSTGPRVQEFERAFAAYVQAPHAVALNSCTAALHLSMLAGGIKPGDEVITTPLTFAASANSIIHAGGTPVFADVDPVTQNIDPKAVEAKITPRTRAILAVHLTGRPCDMDALTAIAKKHNLMLFEDAAHAIEAVYKGRHIGTIGDSPHPGAAARHYASCTRPLSALVCPEARNPGEPHDEAQQEPRQRDTCRPPLRRRAPFRGQARLRD